MMRQFVFMNQSPKLHKLKGSKERAIRQFNAKI